MKTNRQEKISSHFFKKIIEFSANNRLLVIIMVAVAVVCAAYAMKEIGPSIFAAAFCEALAFFIGMLTDVPALYSFCLVAGLSVIADFVL